MEATRGPRHNEAEEESKDAPPIFEGSLVSAFESEANNEDSGDEDSDDVEEAVANEMTALRQNVQEVMGMRETFKKKCKKAFKSKLLRGI